VSTVSKLMLMQHARMNYFFKFDHLESENGKKQENMRLISKH